jgi:UDP-N-acetylmuramate--alanine ligase
MKDGGFAMYRKKIQHIHFVGIGGIGMSGIAEVLLNLGYRVSGSDLRDSDITRRLQGLGATIYCGHNRENLKDVNVVVVSSAVRPGNPEVQAAHERLIPVIPRAEMLAELMRMKYGIAVAGTHGKTTTTSLIATILGHGHLDPTAVIGGRLNSIGSNAKLGQGEFLVAEADESDGSFLNLSPTIAVITTIDLEHVDHYPNIEAIRQAFLQFINKVPFYGLAVLCLDQENVQAILPEVRKRFVTYGMTPQADFRADTVTFDGLYTTFDLIRRNHRIGRLRMRVPGMHNVYNAMAAVATAFELDLGFDVVQEALAEFSGVQRRFQIKGEVNGVLVMDDYAHHPAEIKATLETAKKSWNRRVVAVFQPHRYTRTSGLFDEFLTAFYQADILILTDIYAAGEDRIEGVETSKLFEGIRGRGHRDVTYIPQKEAIADHLLKIVRENDLVLTMGAGNIWQVSDELVEKLKGTSEKPKRATKNREHVG